MKKLFFSLSLLTTFISFSTQAAPQFRVFGRLFNPNRCQYFSTIVGQFIVETEQENTLGTLTFDASIQQSSTPNIETSWASFMTVATTPNITPEETYLYRTELNGVVTARGSYSHDAIRFKVRTSKATYPETAELYYYVKFGDVLRIGCDPDNDAFTELPVSIECTGDAKTCSELSSLN